MRNYLVYYLSSVDEVYECAYSVLKYLDVYNLKPPPDHSLVVCTRWPALLEAYGSFFNQFKVQEMESESKAVAIRKFCSEYQGNILYLDSNTYPVKELDSLFLCLAQGSLFATYHAHQNGPGMRVDSLDNLSVLGIHTPLTDAIETVLQIKKPGPVLNYFEQYEDLKEFRFLLRDFFDRYQEESVPNQMKLIHYIDAKQIEDQKKLFRQLPFYQRILRKMTGRAWNITDYTVRV